MTATIIICTLAYIGISALVSVAVGKIFGEMP